MARTKITKRKGIAGFFPPTRNKAAKTADEVECGQLRCEVHALEVQRAGLWKTQRELEEQKRELEEQKREVEEQLRLWAEAGVHSHTRWSNLAPQAFY